MVWLVHFLFMQTAACLHFSHKRDVFINSTVIVNIMNRCTPCPGIYMYTVKTTVHVCI